MMNTTPTTTSSAPSIAPGDRLPPALSQEAASDFRPPSLVARMPQASAFAMLPAFSGDVVARTTTPPQLRPATELLDLPNDLLRHLTSFLRTANTIPAIRNVARFRAACKDLYLRIKQPIPDGIMGLIEFNRLEDLKQMLVEVQQSGKCVLREVNCEQELVTDRRAHSKYRYLPPLMAAAFLGRTEMVALLEKAGANVEASSFRRTALMLAAKQGHTETVQALIRAKSYAYVDQEGRSGATALMEAAKNGHTATVQALLDAGANCKCRNDAGETALDLAIQHNHDEIIKRLRAHGASEQ